MVEAAVIFPLVIAGVMAVLYIVINLYLSVSLQSSLHLALRKESGELSRTVYRQEVSENFQSEKDLIGAWPVIRMEKEREYRIDTLFRYRITRKEEGRSYIIDEAELLRILFFADGEEL